MIILLSSTKTQDLSPINNNIKNLETSKPIFITQANLLVKKYNKLSQSNLKTIFNTSEKILQKTILQFQNFSKKNNQNSNLKPAIFMYTGLVYKYLDANNFNKQDIKFAQNNLLILSGLYGLLKPLDNIKPYRLEMKLEYTFWKDIITKYLLDQNKIIINLASNESLLALDKNKLENKIINIIFKEYKNNKLVNIATYAKMARGNMANYIIKNKINNIKEIKKYNNHNYIFNKNLSDDFNFIFVR